ncbi:MAG: hypothetical protein MZW92_03225 [Comamonadaceae bacterium]|nr:hypothetical protein [Comamonadaceae bacterium]
MRPNTRARRGFAVLAVLAAAALIAAGTAAAQHQGPETLGFKKQFFVDVVNPSPFVLENHALVIDVADIRASIAPDFNTYFYAFFEEKGRRARPRRVPGRRPRQGPLSRRDRRRPDAPALVDDAPDLLVHARAQLPALPGRQGLRPRSLGDGRRRGRLGIEPGRLQADSRPDRLLWEAPARPHPEEVPGPRNQARRLGHGPPRARRSEPVSGDSASGTARPASRSSAREPLPQADRHSPPAGSGPW